MLLMHELDIWNFSKTWFCKINLSSYRFPKMKTWVIFGDLNLISLKSSSIGVSERKLANKPKYLSCGNSGNPLRLVRLLLERESQFKYCSP